jgi:hypothetical protein
MLVGNHSYSLLTNNYISDISFRKISGLFGRMPSAGNFINFAESRGVQNEWPDFLIEVPAIFLRHYLKGVRRMKAVRNLFLEKLAVYSEVHPEHRPFSCIKGTDRRSTIDRRKKFTFIGNDKRSGIADRRKKTPSVEALVRHWKMKSQKT